MTKQLTSMALTTEHYLGRMTALFALVCAAAILLYGVFLLEAVAHAASQTATQRQISRISAQLSDLEAQYLSYSQSLTKEKAVAMGFVAPKETATVFATAATQALSLRGSTPEAGH